MPSRQLDRDLVVGRVPPLRRLDHLDVRAQLREEVEEHEGAVAIDAVAVQVSVAGS